MIDIKALENCILVFDIDGVLARYFFKDYNVKCFNIHDWVRMNFNEDMYLNAESTSLFKDLIKRHNPDELFSLSTAFSSFEQNNKISFILREYPRFNKENILFVGRDEFKVDILVELYKKYSKRVILIEDNSGILQSVEDLKDRNILCYLVSDFI